MSAGRRILFAVLGVVLTLSIVLNFYLVVAIAAQLGGGMNKTVIRDGDSQQVVAVYGIGGVINATAVSRFRQFFRDVVNDKDVKAVVLRISSPGGGVASSDQICNMVKRLRKAGKKVVVSMGSVAASGGYYISAPADMILAEPTTVTGSIGVIMAWQVISGTLDKIGMKSVLLKSSHARGWKDEVSPLRQPDQRQLRHLQGVLDQIQAKFEQTVKLGRGTRLHTREASYTIPVGDEPGAKAITVNETEPFNGKIYLADEAVSLGLVDRIGYRNEAFAAAARLAGLADPLVRRYRPHRGLLTQIIQGKTHSVLDLGIDSLDELQTPRLMMLWKAD